MVEFVLFKIGDELRELTRSYVNAIRLAWRTERYHSQWAGRVGKSDWIYQYMEHNPDHCQDAAYATWLEVYGID